MDGKKERRPPSSRDIRWFGVIALAAGLLAARALHRHGHADGAAAAVAAGAIILLLALAAPRAALPLYRIWMAFGRAMGAVTSRLIMSLIFFLVLTPVAVLFRLIGRDALRRRRDPNAVTYWVTSSRIDDKRDYEHLF